MRVLLTGAAGGLGRLVAAKLTREGHEVVGVDRRPWARPAPGVRFVRSALKPEEAQALFAGAAPEALVLLGGLHNARAAAPAQSDRARDQGAAALHATQALRRL